MPDETEGEIDYITLRMDILPMAGGLPLANVSELVAAARVIEAYVLEGQVADKTTQN